MPSVIARARGTATIVRELPGQHRIPYAPRERIYELRDRRVRATAAYAAACVPFYRELFAGGGIDVRDLSRADDLERLPLLDKTSVHGMLERFRPVAVDPRQLVPMRSSGRSGAWLEVAHDRASLLRAAAHAERIRAVEAHFCGRRYRYPLVEIRSLQSTVVSVRRVYGQTSYRPFRPRVHVIPIETPVEQVVAELNRLRPLALRTYGSYAEVFFRTVAAADLELALPRVVRYGGDAMSAGSREFVERRFGVPVISGYGAAEAPILGFMCEERAGFHVNEDLYHVRLVAPDGSNVGPGQSGEVVVSNLVNRGTVLLNYRLGDYARWLDEPCACGRSLPRLGDLEGRVAEVLRLGGGRLVHQYAVWSALTTIDGLVNFQLVQRDQARFELRLQPAGRERYEEVAATAVHAAERVLPGCVVAASYAEQLDLERRNGKLERIVPLA